MNDWLDYKGSGSSRAYMGNTISHGLFGIQTKKDKDDMANKQKNADIRLLNAYKTKKNNLEVELNKLKTQLKDCAQSIKDADARVESGRRALQDAEITRSNIGTKGPYAIRSQDNTIEQYKKVVKDLESNAARWRKRYGELESSISKIEDEIVAVDQKIIPLELSLKQRAR